MDWAKEGKGNRNPVVILNGDKGTTFIKIVCKPGDKIKLNSSKSIDPDGDKMHYKWWVLPEAGSYFGDIQILDSESSIAVVLVPSDAAGRTFHIICEVTDNGAPNLTSYRRVIFEPK